MQSIELIYNITLGIMTVVSLALTIISMIAYKRTRSKRMLMITSAFFLFLVKGLWLSYSSFMEPITDELYFLIPMLVLDTVILITFYVCALKG